MSSNIYIGSIMIPSAFDVSKLRTFQGPFQDKICYKDFDSDFHKADIPKNTIYMW